MSDLERLCKLFDDFGVKYKRDTDPFNKWQEIYIFQKEDLIDEDQSDKVHGYIGFYTVYQFDQEGRFISMGAYE